MRYASYQAASQRARSYILLGWIITLLAGVFYMYEYFLRIAPSVMADDLMRYYGISATGFGTMYALYYFIYAPMQLPVGLLMDRFGPRRLLTLACLVCAAGAYMFVASPHFTFAIAGRVLVGFGSAFAFIGVLKLATIWLPPERFGFVSGLASALGALAGMGGDISMTALVNSVGWRGTLFGAAIVGVVLSLLIWFVVRDSRQQRAHHADQLLGDFSEMWRDVWAILKSRQILLIGLVGAFLYLPATSFAETWGIPYLQAAHGLSDMQAASANSMVFFGFMVGAPLMGVISDKIGKRIVLLMIGGAVATVLMLTLLYAAVGMSHAMVYGLLLSIGVAYSVHPLVFAVGRDLSSKQYAGTAVAIVNAFVMLGGAVLPRLIGDVLDGVVDLHATGAVHYYTASDYTVALTLVPLGMLFGVVLCFWVHESGTAAEQPCLQQRAQASAYK